MLMKIDRFLKSDLDKVDGRFESSNSTRKLTTEPSDLIREDQLKNEFMTLYNSGKRNSGEESEVMRLNMLNTIFRKIREKEQTDKTTPLFIIK